MKGIDKFFEGCADFNPSLVLAVNPRDGRFLKQLFATGVSVDSFVSDDEWVEDARRFSREVFHAYSHHPLAALQPKTYDAVIICEDMGFVDDCDAMLRSYARLLKDGGSLFGINANLSYAKTVSAFINNNPTDIKSDVFGYSCIPVDCLLARLKELSFKNVSTKAVYGDVEDVSVYTEVSSRNLEPLSEESFLTEFYCIIAVK